MGSTGSSSKGRSIGNKRGKDVVFPPFVPCWIHDLWSLLALPAKGRFAWEKNSDWKIILKVCPFFFTFSTFTSNGQSYFLTFHTIDMGYEESKKIRCSSKFSRDPEYRIQSTATIEEKYEHMPSRSNHALPPSTLSCYIRQLLETFPISDRHKS